MLPKLESGGVERGTIEITAAIRQAGMVPLVASAGGSMVPHVTHAGGQHINLPLHRKNPLVIFQNARRLAKLIRERQISLIHARSRAPAWAAYFAAKWTGIPLVTTFHGVYGLTGLGKKAYNRVMTYGARVIAISQYVREHLLEQYQLDPGRIRLIPRGVDFAVFGERHINSERLASLTRQWRLPDEHVPIIFCPGRISRIKGQHVLIAALAQLTDMDFLCIIAGKDEGHEDFRAELKAQIIASGLEGKVRLADATKAMNEAYQLSQLVVVSSSKPEAFGRIAIEAQAMGVAVVATDHGGARETIIPNETGYLVPPEDPTAMAEAIRYALTRDEATVRAMADFARRHVQRHFTSDQMKEKTIAVYREVLQLNELQPSADCPTEAEPLHAGTHA